MYKQDNLKLFQLIGTLTPQEHKKFKRWVTYKHPREGDPVIKLYQVLKFKKHRDREVVISILYPHLKKDDPLIRKHFNILTKDIEDFFISESLVKSSPDRNLHLIKEYSKRGLNHNALLAIKRERKYLESLPLKDDLNYLHSYLLEGIYQEQLVKTNARKEIRREKQLNFALDKWVIVEILKLSVLNLTYSRNYSKKVSSFFLEEVLHAIEANQTILEDPGINLWYSFYTLFSTESDSLYHPLFELFKTYKKFLRIDTAQNLFLSLLNFKTLQSIKLRSTVFYHDLLKLYQWGLDEKLLVIRDQIPSRIYKNLIHLTIWIGNLSLARKYLESLKKQLPLNDQEEAYKFNLAHIHFAEKDFSSAKLILTQIDYSNVFTKISGRFLLIMTYYELGERIFLENQLHSLNAFVRTQREISKEYKAIVLDRIKLLEKILKVNSRQKLKVLLEKMQELELSLITRWIREKIQTLLSDL